MSGGFGLPVLNLQDAIGKIGTAYTDAYDKTVQQGALQALGTQLQAGNYAGAAKTAFDAGDAATGLSLIKLGQSAEQAKQASAAFGGVAALYGAGAGGAGGGAMGLNGPTGAAPAGVSRGGGATPTFLDLGGPSGGYLSGLIQRESGGNPNARVSTSSATGLGQFTDKTWAGVMRAHPELGLTATGRTDPDQSVRALKAFTADNSAGLQKAGLPVNDASLYASHFLGASGGPRFVAGAVQSPDAPAASFADPRAVAANRNVFFNRDGSPKTAGQVMGDFQRSFGGGRSAQAAPQAPVQVASADPNSLALPQGASGLNPAIAAGRSAPAPFVAIPGTPAQAPQQAAAPDAVPTLAQPALTRPPMQMPGAAPAQTDGEEEDGTSAAVTPPTVSPPTVAAPNRQQISAQAPQHLEQAGLPASASVAVGNTQPGSQSRVGVLMRIAGMPGLNEGQSKVVGALLANELDQTKLPETVKQYLFAKSPAGGGFDGSFADFQNKKGDEGAKVQAQFDAREKWMIAHGLDPKDPINRSIIMGGKPSGPHVGKQGDVLWGPDGQVLAKNDGGGAGGMSDEQAAYTADRVIAGDTKALIGLDKGSRGKITALAAQRAIERGIDPSDILHNAAVASGMNAEERSRGTSAARMGNAAVEAEGAIAQGRAASAAVPRGSFVPLNRAMQVVQSNTGDPALKAFVAANMAIANTYARAISPTGTPTVADKEHAYHVLSTADGPDAYNAVLDQYQREIGMAHGAPAKAAVISYQERQAAKRGGDSAPTMVPNPMQPSGAPARDQNAPRFQAAPPAAINDARAKIREGYSVDQIKDAMRRKGFEPPPDL